MVIPLTRSQSAPWYPGVGLWGGSWGGAILGIKQFILYTMHFTVYNLQYRVCFTYYMYYISTDTLVQNIDLGVVTYVVLAFCLYHIYHRSFVPVFNYMCLLIFTSTPYPKFIEVLGVLYLIHNSDMCSDIRKQ